LSFVRPYRRTRANGRPAPPDLALDAHQHPEQRMLAARDPRRPLAVFARLTLCIYAAALEIVSTPLLVRAPRAISGALTLDLLVTVPLLYWLLVVRRTRVAAATLLPLFVASAAAAHAVLPAGQQGWLSLGAVLVIRAEAALMGMAAFRARAMVRRMRGRPRAADPFDALRDALREMLGSRAAANALASEAALVWYALFSWRARPRVGDGEAAFTTDRRTGAAGLLFGLAVASAMEASVVHVLLAPRSAVAAWALTGVSVYGMLWILGFARALRLHPGAAGR
jgi:hypothetical protein